MKDLLLDKDLDIKDLGVTKEVLEEQPFDAEKEFTGEDWQNIISAFMDWADRAQNSGEARANAIRLGFSLGVLSPDRFGETLRRRKGQFKDKLRWYGFKEAFVHPNGRQDFVTASKYRLMFRIRRSVVEAPAQSVLNDLVPYAGSIIGQPLKSLELLFAQKVLFPGTEKLPWSMNISRVCPSGDMLSLLRLNALSSLRKSEEYYAIAELGALARLCFCEEYRSHESQNPLGITGKDWTGMRQALRILRVRVPGELVVFAERASYMQILAAQDVYFRATRLSLGPVVPQEILVEDNQEIPVGRAY